METPEPTAPRNECPNHACNAYLQGGARSCQAGACVIDTPVAGLLLVIGLPVYSQAGPGQTALISVNGPVEAADGCTAIEDCAPSSTCSLLKWATDVDRYAVNLAANDQAHWYLGNPKTATTLPVSATFRPLLGPGLVDAIDLGLPLQPITAVRRLDQLGLVGVVPGPNGTTPFVFVGSMPPGCYERTLQPYAPLSSAFPPEIKVWPPDDDPQNPISAFDPTSKEILTNGETASPEPIFDISRAEGLDGWTAYLRNIENGRVYSNVASLKGSLEKGVTLLTNHSNPRVSVNDALNGLALVIAPPADAALPTEVLAPFGPAGAQELPQVEPYPSLPTPVTMSGRLATPEGVPVPADVIFTATDITDRTGKRFPPNFEFVTRTSTTVDAGAARYSVLLPRGDYQIAVRPTDASSAVTVLPYAVGQQGDLMTGKDIDVGAQALIAGSVIVTDGRRLAEGLVEALPMACASPPPSSLSASDACLPRYAQALTQSDGTFSVALDPGTYRLRVSPAQGTRLPWVTETITVGPASKTLPPIAIPAPVQLSMTLQDSTGNPATNTPGNPVS
ncbi:MAG TPA: hypothetical protein VH044_02315, partial [Polyangiaceae bacterium]|nr:hypothetical protein [Polyangiaceae bacterium]